MGAPAARATAEPRIAALSATAERPGRFAGLLFLRDLDPEAELTLVIGAARPRANPAAASSKPGTRRAQWRGASKNKYGYVNAAFGPQTVVEIP
jgi:hypothetical protein